ncbi:bacterio-opsin activator domain-containing protein [Haloarchaeobius sp. HRN-SO-5]|uniref:bacterio-opsin activator domain-containing protein n=1 Tax=Haloarchaeobius sp. HRN-SO-5 TaxID=3446118 RepID=UPI003EBFD45C
MGERGPDPKISRDAAVAIFEAAPSGEPYTSSEVADRLDCARTTAYGKLQDLVDDGTLRTKKVGARGRVWWLPAESDTSVASGDGRSDGTLDTEEGTFRAVFEGAFDAILIADDDARYVDANPAACELFGLPREELVGRSITEFAAEDYDVESAWRAFHESDADRGLFPLVRADGEERVVEFGATTDVLPGRHLSILRDVTEYREVEAQLQSERARAQQYQKTLYADEVVEVEFETTDDGDFFVSVSDRLDCRCTFEGMVSTTDETMLHYVRVDGAPPEDVLAVAEATPEVDDCRVVHRSEGDALFEVDLETSAVKTLIAAGASGRTVAAEGGHATIVAETAPEADLHGVIDALLDRYPDSEFVAKRTLSRPFMTTRQYHDSLRDRFTDRQLETLRAAFLAGYYEWPRQSTAENVAASMGVASSTWLRHLRKAERTLVRSFFDELAI